LTVLSLMSLLCVVLAEMTEKESRPSLFPEVSLVYSQIILSMPPQQRYSHLARRLYKRQSPCVLLLVLLPSPLIDVLRAILQR
jgi:hypothetical protein